MPVILYNRISHAQWVFKGRSTSSKTQNNKAQYQANTTNGRSWRYFIPLKRYRNLNSKNQLLPLKISKLYTDFPIFTVKVPRQLTQDNSYKIYLSSIGTPLPYKALCTGLVVFEQTQDIPFLHVSVEFSSFLWFHFHEARCSELYVWLSL